MMDDATFEDAADAPLILKAEDSEDLAVLAALAQDAVFPSAEMTWNSRTRRFAILLNRFRWEDQPGAEIRKRPYERVQSLLVIDSVLSVASQGIARGTSGGDSELIYSLLSMEFVPGEDGAGRLELTLAGDGALALEVECLDVTLKDVTRPYIAASKSAPRHPE